MEFDIKEDIIDDNLQITVLKGDEEVAKATCYLVNTPEYNGKTVGTIGEFECKDRESGVFILKRCEERFKGQGVEMIVAPMNGNTWKQYRTLKYTNGEPPFLLEKVNPIEHNDILKDAGFVELHTYSSTKGLIENYYDSETLDLIEENIDEENIVIRKFDKTNYMEDLRKIYRVSLGSFSRNPFYTPIDEESFLNQYIPYIDMVDDDFIYIAEKDGKEVAFVFCIPDFNEMKTAGKVSTLILKTIATLPEYEEYAIGNVMVRNVAKKAIEKGFKNWIFAFMYSNNTSQKMAKRNNTEIIREYALYGKEI